MVILRTSAEQDIKDAYEWYEEKRNNLGKMFVLEVGAIFAKIGAKPTMYATVFENIRRALCKRFPYSIYFIEVGTDIVVIGVLHQRRNPTVWQSRK